MKKNATRRNLLHRGLALAMVLMMTAGFSPVHASAARDQSLSGKEEIAVQAAGEQRDPFAPEEGYLMDTRSDMPEVFDLRHVKENGEEKNYVTPVKLQHPYGTCWGFGAIAAAETSLLGSYSSLKADTLDLSEKQVAWFLANAIDDPQNPQNGEGYIFSDDITDSQRYEAGGFTAFATNLFAQGTGPVPESTDTDDGNVFRYKGRRGEVINGYADWYDADGQKQSGYKKLWYSEDDDWSIPEKYRFTHGYKLKESYLLPSPASYADEDKGPAIEAIKEQLLQKHAVAINFSADSSKPSDVEDEGGSINLKTWAHYCPEGYPSTHVVTIVGYDDHYPKTNFKADRQPPADGAWLVKNSWGSDLNSFPDNGYRHWGLREGQDIPGSDYEAVSEQSTGYFWLSYYDATTRDPEAYSFEMADTDYLVEQHDFMPVLEYEEYATESENRTANVFTAGRDEKLTDISFFTATPGTSVSYSVYILNENASGPEDGRCLTASEPVTYPFGGYHRVTLPEDCQTVLPKGQKYSIVVTQITPAGKYSISFSESDGEEKIGYRGAWFKAVVNEGESFLYLDKEWNDLSDPAIRELLKNGAKGMEIDNFSIKAYSVPADTNGGFLTLKTGGGQDITEIEERQSEKIRLIATIRGAKDDLIIPPEITWTLSDPDPVSLEIKNSGSEAVLTLAQPGTTLLTIDAGIYGKKEIPIHVPDYEIADGEVPEEARIAVYTGQPYEPELVNVYASVADYEKNYDVVKDVDYTVSYENNILCGRGDVILRGIGKYGGEVRSSYMRYLDFRIIPAKAEIKKLTPGKSKLKVDFVSQKASGIDGYVLTYKEKGSEEEKTLKVDAGANSATIFGLTAGKTYEVSLKAYVTVDEEVDWDYDTESYIGGPTDYFGEASATVSGGAVLEGDPFEDVSKTSYFYEAVNWAVKNAITNGVSDAAFGPGQACTRAQAVTFLWRANGCESTFDPEDPYDTVENPFTDISQSDYYYDAVLWAVKKGITNGTTDTTFGPKETCTRGQIAAFLWRSKGKPASAASIDFEDVSPHSFYYDPVRWAVKKGITKGTSDKAFEPKAICTRGQIVTFLYRADTAK